MLEINIFNPLMDSPSTALMWASLGAGVALCCFGYALYRLVMTAAGGLAGASIAAAIVETFIQTPSNLDYIIPCSAMGLLLAMLSLFFYRQMFSILLLVLAGLAIYTQMERQAQVWPVVVIAFAGLVAAGLSLIHLKAIFIFITSLLGGLLTAYFFWLLVGYAKSWWMIVVVIISGLLLGAMGFFIQYRITSAIRSRLSPQSRRGRGSPRSARLRL